MNALIKKAIVEFKGVWPYELDGLIVTTDKHPTLEKGSFSYWEESLNNFNDSINVNGGYWEWVCTKEEFEATALSLFDGTTPEECKVLEEWMPDIGVECEYSMGDSNTWWRCEIKYILKHECEWDGGFQVVAYCNHLGCDQVLYEDPNDPKKACKFRPAQNDRKKLRDKLVSLMTDGYSDANKESYIAAGWGDIADKLIDSGMIKTEVAS